MLSVLGLFFGLLGFVLGSIYLVASIRTGKNKYRKSNIAVICFAVVAVVINILNL